MSDLRSRAAVAAAIAAGTLVRFGRAPVRALPGAAGAAAVAIGLGVIAGRLAGHGLAPWCALAIGGVFALLFAAELNATPRDRRRSGGIPGDPAE